MEELLAELNQEQRQAVIHDNGPLLIVAGAGTGKTTVLIKRLLYLITVKGIKADNILLVTFTEKGAHELLERADKALPYGYTDLWISTFHGLAERILKEHGLDIGLPTDYQLLNQTQQWIFIKKNLDKFALDYYRPLGSPDKFLSELVKHFSRLKDENISAAQYLAYAEELRQNKDAMLSGVKRRGKKTEENLDSAGKLSSDQVLELANAYHTYNRLMLAEKFLDFGDLLTYALQLLRQRPDILKYYQEKFSYLMVDEFQDTNYAQYELIKLLAAPHNNLVAVGDDDQSIFKFRGASLSNIMQFKSDYPAARQIVLTANYRSGQIILDRAYQLINCNNPNRLEIKLNLDKHLTAQRPDGEVKYLFWPNLVSETKGVVEMIKGLERAGSAAWSEVAILVRANATADRLVQELARQGVPHQFISLKGLYYKSIILDILAYLRLLDNYHESGALFRVLNLPPFKVNHQDLINLLRFAKSKLWSLYEVLQQATAVPKISAVSQANITSLLIELKRHSQLVKEKKVSQLYVQLVKDMLLPGLAADRPSEDFNYLNQFYRKIINFETTNPGGLLPDFLNLIDWELAAGDSGSLQLSWEDAETVKVMTVHTAKGLEFKYVFIVDAVEKKFPTINRSEAIPIVDALVKEAVPAGATHLEEERRLFYVAMTRAKNGLFISGARDHGGVAEKRPSKFIAEAGLEATALGSAEKLSELECDLAGLDQAPAVSEFKWQLPKHFSFSQLDTFARCPWLYRYKYLLKLPVPPKPAMVFGQVLHSVLRQWLEPLADGGQGALFGAPPPTSSFSGEGLQKIYEELWRDDGYDSREQAEKFRQRGRAALKLFYEQFQMAPLPSVLFLEKKFFPKIDSGILNCTLDRVDRLADGSVAILDYKTGEAKSKLTFDDKRQLLIYQLALEQLTDLKVSQLIFYYLPSGQQCQFTASPKDLEKVKDWVSATIAAIGQFNFTPAPSPHVCRHCDWRQICQFRQV